MFRYDFPGEAIQVSNLTWGNCEICSDKMIRKIGIALLLLLNLFLIVIWLFENPGYATVHVFVLYLIFGFLLGTLFDSFRPPLYLHLVNVMVASVLNGVGLLIANFKWISWIEIKPHYAESNLVWGLVAGVLGTIGVCIGVALQLSIRWLIKKKK